MAEQKRSAFAALGGGGGVFYRIDEGHEGELVFDDYWLLGRSTLESAGAVCVAADVIARAFQRITMRLVQEDGTEYEPRTKHPVLELINNGANEFQTGAEYRSNLARELVFCGEAISRVHRDVNRPRRLYLWDSEATYIDQDQQYDLEAIKSLFYQWGTRTVPFDPEMPGIMHIRLNAHPLYPLRGRPNVHGMQTEVLTNIYASKYRSEVYRQGGPPRNALAPEKDSAEASPEQATEIASTFTRGVKGPSSYRTTPVIPAGWKVEDLGPEGTDPLMLNGSRHSDERILAAYGIPVQFINNLERSTFSNARTEDRKLIRDAVAPWLEVIARCIERDLLRPMGGVNAKLRVEWNTDAVLEAEPVIWNKIILDRFKAGAIRQDEARDELGYDPQGGPKIVPKQAVGTTEPGGKPIGEPADPTPKNPDSPAEPADLGPEPPDNPTPAS